MPGGKEFRLLRIITRLDEGGSAKSVLDISGMSAEKGTTVGIITGKTLHPQTDLKAFSEKYGIKIFHVGNLVREISLLKDLFAFFKIWFIIKKFKPDIVHTHTSKAGILGRFAAKLAGVKRIVHTTHGHVFYGYFNSLSTRIFILAERLAAAVTDKITVLTVSEISDHLERKIGNRSKFAVIHSGIELNKFQQGDGLAIRAEFGLGDKIVVGWAGRLVPIKDCETFIRAASLALKSFPETVFLIAGDGELRNSLETLAGEYGLKNSLIFTGMREDMPSVMAAFDIFVLSSLNEGFGRVIVEAMASGAAVISTAVGGTVEVIEDGVSGILVPPSSPEILAEKILYLIKNGEILARLKKNGKERVKLFDTESMFKKYEDIYEELLKK